MLLAIAVAMLSTVGFVISANVAVSAPLGKLTICHRTNSNTNPYVQITPNLNAVINGHEKHVGPVWNPTLKAQHIKWGDIIPPFTYTKKGVTISNPGLNWTPAGQAIYNNGCAIPAAALNSAAPVSPTLTQSVCVNGVPSAPTLTLQTTTGIVYTVRPVGPYVPGETVTVTARAITGYQFVPPPPTGWTFVNSTHERLRFTFAAAPVCTTTVIPASPTVAQSACTGGQPTTPTVTLVNTPGITYAVAPAPTAGGTSVVTATATGSNRFTQPPPKGWTYVDSTHETFTIHFHAAPSCTTVVAPVSPRISTATCSGATVNAPTLAVVLTPGVVYTVSAAAPYRAGQTVVLSATADSAHQFQRPPPAGWAFVNAHLETFQVTFPSAPTCGGTLGTGGASGSGGAGGTGGLTLANTGAPTQTLLAWAGAALVSGLALQLLGRRRHRRV